MHEMSVRLENHTEVSAFVPLYEGKNVIDGKALEEIATLVAAASGTEGSCLAYVKGIAEKLSDLEIHDPGVSEFLCKANLHE